MIRQFPKRRFPESYEMRKRGMEKIQREILKVLQKWVEGLTILALTHELNQRCANQHQHHHQHNYRHRHYAHLPIEKHQVAQILDKLLKDQGVVQVNAQNKWQLTCPQKKPVAMACSPLKTRYIMVDLGQQSNCVKLFQNLHLPADTELRGYADYGYDAAKSCPQMKLVVSDSGYKNAADTTIIMDVAELIALSLCKLSFCILTCDKGFRELEPLVRRKEHQLVFVANFTQAISWLQNGSAKQVVDNCPSLPMDVSMSPTRVAPPMPLAPPLAWDEKSVSEFSSLL